MLKINATIQKPHPKHNIPKIEAFVRLCEFPLKSRRTNLSLLPTTTAVQTVRLKNVLLSIKLMSESLCPNKPPSPKRGTSVCTSEWQWFKCRNELNIYICKSGLETIDCKSYLSIFGDHLPNISQKNNDIECKLSFECRHMQPFSLDTWKAKH